MSDEPEEGFTFRDRRRVHIDDAPVSEPAPAPVATPPAAPAVETFAESDDLDEIVPGGIGPMDEMDDAFGEGEGGPGEIPDVYTVLMLFMGELRNLAWLRLGLVPNPTTGQMEVDLDQAHTAIDTITFLAQQIEPVVAPDERLPLKAMVNDLQMRFVERSRQ